MRFQRPGRLIAGGAVLVVTAVAGWVAAVPGASAEETSVPSVMTDYYTDQLVGRQPATATAAQWYVAVADRGLLTVTDQKGTRLGEETPGSHWVALNHGPSGRPPGSYFLEVSYTQPIPLGEYGLQFIGVNWLLNRPGEKTTIGTDDYAHWLVQARKIYLNAGDHVQISTVGKTVESINFLYGKPGDAASAVRNYKSADLTFGVDKFAQEEEVSTFAFVAPATAEYLVVFNRGTFYENTTTVVTKVTPAAGR